MIIIHIERKGGQRVFIRSLLLLIALLLPAHAAFAYSYGDPNKEAIAETYKEVAAKLNGASPDWAGAHQAFASRQKEMVTEFGNQVVQTLERNFAQKDKETLLHNYKAVLVLNVERRLGYAEEQFADYAKAKLLLAKGRGAFQVLSPHVDKAVSAKVFTAFDRALAALGNPGLFGVGAVPANKQEFLAQANLIKQTLKPLYPLKTSAASAKAGQVAGAQASKPTAAVATTTHSSKSSAAPTTTAQQTNQAQAKGSQQTKAVQVQPATGGEKPMTAQQSAANRAQQQVATAGALAQPPVQPAASAQTSQVKPANAATAATASAPTEISSPAQAGQSPNQPLASAAAASADTPPGDSQAAAAHIESSASVSKVNPLVTVSVIGGLIIVIGGLFWLGRRKGLV